jgi:hypothetical protein
MTLLASEGSPTAVRRKRPFGVTVITVIQVLSVIGAAFFVVDELGTREILRDWRLTIVGGIVVVVGLVIALGLWKLRSWAWVGVMLWTGAELAICLAQYLHGIPDYWSMVAGIVVVFYLNQGEVQAAFQRGRSGAEAS